MPPGIGQEARGLISQYRYGQVGNGKSRIVMDTTGPVLIEKSFIIEPQAGQPACIVVDLVATSEEFLGASWAAAGMLSPSESIEHEQFERRRSAAAAAASQRQETGNCEKGEHRPQQRCSHLV